MNARALVAKLLEMSPYDIDDPLDKPEVPAGFRATRGEGDDAEWFHYILDAKSANDLSWVRYIMGRQSQMPGYGDWHRERGLKDKLGSADFGGKYVRKSEAPAWIEQRAKEFEDAGWTVTRL